MNIALSEEVFNKLYKENLNIFHYFCLRLYEGNNKILIEAYDIQRVENYLPIQKLLRIGLLKCDSDITDSLFSLTEKGKEFLQNIENQ